MSRPIGTAAELERRRRRAVALVEQGEPRATVARVLGVPPKTLARWLRRAKQPDGLQAKPQLGPRPRLSDRQLQQLEQLLLDGSKFHGWNNELWTAARVARLIERFFGRSYHPEHVRRLLKQRLGWTSQKPRRKARERDDKEVERWSGDEFPRIVRQAYDRDAYLLLWDESGFFLTPTVRRTLAPRGQTPVLSGWDRRDRLSAISCISLSPVRGRPNLYFRVLDHNAKVVKAFLKAHPDVVAEDFPGYAPDLNPDEGVWGWTKYGRLANLAAEDVEVLWDHVIEELVELKFRPNLLKAFIRQTGLPGLLRTG